MECRFFGGPHDGGWIDIAEPSARQINMAVWSVPAQSPGELDDLEIPRPGYGTDTMVECHRYWRYGTWLVWAGPDA